MFGASANASVKWWITHEVDGVIFFLASSDETTRRLTWSQQQANALKFDSFTDAEKVMALIQSHRKNKNLIFKVK